MFDAFMPKEKVTGDLQTMAATMRGDRGKRVFVLDLSIKCLGTSKKAPVGLIETDADKSLVRLGKKILQCDELKEIRTHQQDLRKTIKRYCIPCEGIYRGGMYLMPYGLLEQIEQTIKDAQDTLGDLVDQFLSAYDRRIADDMNSLQSLFDIENYPSHAEVREAFEIDFGYKSLATDEGLKEFDAELFEREQKKASARLDAAIEAAHDALADEAMKMTTKLVEMLTPDAFGKSKRVQKSVVEAYQEFLTTFGHRNISGDTDLAAMMDRANALLAGKSAESFRGKSGIALRDNIRSQFTDLQAGLSKIVVDAPTRRIKSYEVTDEDDEGGE